VTAKFYQEMVLDDFFSFKAASYNFDWTLDQDNVPFWTIQIIKANQAIIIFLIK